VALLIPSTSFADIGANFGLIRVRIAVRACPKSKPWCRRPKDGDTIGRPYGGSNLSCLHMPSFELAIRSTRDVRVILAWNNASDTLACLESLKRDAPVPSRLSSTTDPRTTPTKRSRLHVSLMS